MTKQCTKCNEVKSIEDFYMQSSGRSDRQSYCKSCSIRKAKESSKTRGRTKDGFIAKLYSSQKSNSKRRKHDMPKYSLQDLKDWLYAQPEFHHLFHLWEVSNYDKLLIPSIDRKDDYETYSFSNIQLMTWSQNKAKYEDDIASGKNNKTKKAVMQFTKSGEYLQTFTSIKVAAYETNGHTPNIVEVCKGRIPYAGGFIWKYAEENNIKEQ